MSQLEPLRNATSLLRLRKGLILRAFDVLDGLLTAVGKEIEQVDACIETLARGQDCDPRHAARQG